jgi:VWFA-related protein
LGAVTRCTSARVHGCTGALVLGCVAIGFAVIVAARSQDPQRPIFRAKADAVTLDVAVMDKSGQPVTDLAAADFDVVEQGKPQKIETFELVDIDRRPPATSNLYHDIRTMESLEQEVGNRNSRLIVIFLDDYHILPTTKDFDYQAERQVRIQLAQYLRGLDSRDLVALMYPLTPVTGLSFSRNHDADARIVEKFEGRQDDYEFPKNAIEEEHLRKSGGNKALIAKFRADVVRTALQGLCTFLGTTRDTRKQVLIVSTWVPGGNSGFEFDDFRQIQRAAAQSNTAIYPWDPRGLLVYPNSDMREHEWFRVLADQTGGRAIVNTNDGLPGMRSMLTDSSAYYVIGYSSTENAQDGKFHEVKVKVKRPDLQVRAKPGYWALDADALARSAIPLPPPVPAEVNAALDAAEAPEQGRPMLAWAGFDRDASGAAIVTVAWEAGEGRTPIDHADIVAASDASSYRGRGPRSVTFPAKPGEMSIRVVASGADASPVDTAFLTLTVPPVTGVQIATPRFYKGPTMKAVTMADAQPTASREFTRQDEVIVRVHGWSKNGDTAISARLLSDHGVVLQDLSAQADTIVVPVSGLGLGRYVIEFTATDGAASAKVLAAFRVK